MNSPKVLATIEGCQIILDGQGRVRYTAKAAIDSDGTPGNPGHDPDWQADTSLHHEGKPVDANKVPYVVVPPAIINGVKPIVLGCQAIVRYGARSVLAVVADIGPHKKLGEISMECARRLGIDPSPTHGGVDDHSVHYEIMPGIPAIVDGVQYKLQPSTAR